MDKKKYFKGPPDVVYNIDGASYGMDDKLLAAIRTSIRGKVESSSLAIPRLPQTAARILQLSQHPNVQLPDVAQAVKGDPLLAARVLTVCNSAAFGATGQVTSLVAAVARLGLKGLRDLVFAESMQSKVFPARAYRRLLEKSWRLSLGAGVACEILSKATGLERDSAFLIGLLHEIGKPTLVNTLTEYERQNGGQPLGEELVEIVLSQLHEEIGAFVLEKWEMPESIVEGARRHHLYSERAGSAHQIIHAANLLCEHLGIGDQRDVYFNLERVFSDLKLDLPTVEAMLDPVTAGLDELMAGFGGVSTSKA